MILFLLALFLPLFAEAQPDCPTQPFTVTNGSGANVTGMFEIDPSTGDLLVIFTGATISTPFSVEVTAGSCTFPSVTVPSFNTTIPFRSSCIANCNEGQTVITILVTPDRPPSPLQVDPFSQTFTYTCCTATCVHTALWWATHNKFERNRCHFFPWLLSEETLLCDKTWLHILKSDNESAWYKLAQQWIAAQLNASTGTPVPAEVALAITEAGALLNECHLKAKSTKQYQLLTEILCAYNSGTVPEFPPLCCCCTLTSVNCVNTKEFWKTHNRFETASCNQVAWPVGANTSNPAEETLLCNLAWIEIMEMPAKTEWDRLAQEWIAAELNLANGVTIPPEIADILASAKTLLSQCQTQAHGQAYEILTKLLHQFNTGEFNSTDSAYPPSCCCCKCP